MADIGTQRVSTPGECGYCGCPCSSSTLKHASLPSLWAIVAVGLVEPDDTDPLPWHQVTDRVRYCPSCRSRVNLRRGFSAAAILGLLIMMTYLLIGI
jgi:hypothetical protein